MTGKRILLCGLVHLCIAGVADADEAPLLHREPDYEGKPRYAVLAFGQDAATHVWLVEDGKRLYIDGNANGDLTDDGPPRSFTSEKKFYSSVSGLPDFQAKYAPFDLALVDGGRNTGLAVHRYRTYARDETSLSITLDGLLTMHSSRSSFWGKSPETAPVIRVSDGLSPRLLTVEKYEIGQKPDALAIGFFTPNASPGAPTLWMGLEGLPGNFPIVVHIRWPTASPGSSIETSHRLTERCCGHRFYTRTFELPANLAPGTAVATVQVPVTFPGTLATNRFEIPVVAKPIPVASRKKLID